MYRVAGTYWEKSFEGRFTNIPLCLPGVESTEEGSGSYSTDSVMWLTSHLSLLWLWLSTKTTRPHMSLSILAHMNPIYVQHWETLFKLITWHWITSKEAWSAGVYDVSLLFYTGNKPAQHNISRGIYNLHKQEATKHHLSFTYKVSCFLIGHAPMCPTAN